MTKINIGLLKHKNITNIEIDKDFKDIKLSDIMVIVKQHYPNGANVIGWAEIETTKVTLKSKYHTRYFEIERLPLKKALQCQKIQYAFRKIKGYEITSLSYGINGVSSIELSAPF